MKLIVDNIGNVEHAEVDITGITVIAGHNGTGKSTISRSLFSIFSSYFDVYNKITKDRIKSINDILENYLSDIDIEVYSHSAKETRISRRIPPRILVRDISRLISDSLFEIIDTSYEDVSADDIRQIIIDSIEKINEENSRYHISKIENMDLESIVESINAIVSQSNISIFNQILTENFQDEFHNQINNIFTQQNGKVTLQVKNTLLTIDIVRDSVTTTDLVNFRTDVVYIDDAAAIVDNSFMNEFWYEINPKLNHNSHLIEQMRSNDSGTHTNKALVNYKIDNIFDQLNSVLVTESVNSIEAEEDDKKLNIINYSSGMKTFYLIKSLLERGVIRENGTLILDEPEVHLHPEWQLKFAEIIVLLQKEFGLHILINTHSPYLVESIDIFSKKHATNDSIKYYLSKNHLEDVSDSIDKIYEQMYVPLNRLEELAEDFDDE